MNKSQFKYPLTSPCQLSSDCHDPVILRSSPTGSNLFFAAVKSSDANIAISGTFLLNAKNSTVSIYQHPRLSHQLITDK